MPDDLDTTFMALYNTKGNPEVTSFSKNITDKKSEGIKIVQNYYFDLMFLKERQKLTFKLISLKQTEITIVKKEMTSRKTLVHNTQHRKVYTEQHELHPKLCMVS